MNETNVSGVLLSAEQVQWLENEYGVEENWWPVAGDTSKMCDEICGAVHQALPVVAETRQP